MQRYPIGPSSWPDWIKRLFPYQKRFGQAACVHDWLYGYGGWEKEKDVADREFFAIMLEASETPAQRMAAYSYYALVRAFGRFYFNYIG